MEKELKQIIEYAVSRGFNLFNWEAFNIYYSFGQEDGVRFYNKGTDKGVSLSITELIFDHDFLRAYFGEERVCQFCMSEKCGLGEWCGRDGRKYDSAWKGHAQNLVLLPDKEKIEYLIKHIK